MKKRKLAAHRPGAEAADEGVVVESEDAATTPTGGSKDRMELEEPKDSDEEMSDRWLVFSPFVPTLFNRGRIQRAHDLTQGLIPEAVGVS